MDGLAAAYAAMVWLGSDIEIFPASYGDTNLPDVTDKEVYMFDFSYPREIILDMQSKAKSFVVVDHHASAKDALCGLECAHFDMTKSGAMLAWEYLVKRNETREYVAPALFHYVQDRDLWQWQLPRSKEVNEYIRSVIDISAPFEEQLETFERLVQEFEIGEYADKGEFLLAEKEKLVAEVTANWFRIPLCIVVDGEPELFWVPVCFAPARIYSEAAGFLAAMPENELGVAACIGNPRDGMFPLSFRSVKGNAMAKAFALSLGGGGHDQAAGCAVNYFGLSEMLASAKR